MADMVAALLDFMLGVVQLAFACLAYG